MQNCAADAVHAPLVTAAMPFIADVVHPAHASAVPALDVASLAPTGAVPAGSGEVLQATAAALGMLDWRQPAELLCQPDAAAAPVATGLEARPVMRSVRADVRHWDGDDQVILISQ